MAKSEKADTGVGGADAGGCFPTPAAALAGVADAATHVALLASLRAAPYAEVELAAALDVVPRFYLGPLQVRLATLERLTGPGPQWAYPEEPARFQSRVADMVSAIADGWVPPPLLIFAATWQLFDGSHRHAALSAFGRDSHPALLLFESPELRRAYALGAIDERTVSS